MEKWRKGCREEKGSPGPKDGEGTARVCQNCLDAVLPGCLLLGRALDTEVPIFQLLIPPFAGPWSMPLMVISRLYSTLCTENT